MYMYIILDYSMFTGEVKKNERNRRSTSGKGPEGSGLMSQEQGRKEMRTKRDRYEFTVSRKKWGGGHL